MTWKLTALGGGPGLELPRQPEGGRLDDALKGRRSAYFPEKGDYVETPIYDRDRLPVGAWLAGPAIVEESESTTVLPPGCRRPRGPPRHAPRGDGRVSGAGSRGPRPVPDPLDGHHQPVRRDHRLPFAEERDGIAPPAPGHPEVRIAHLMVRQLTADVGEPVAERFRDLAGDLSLRRQREAGRAGPERPAGLTFERNHSLARQLVEEPVGADREREQGDNRIDARRRADGQVPLGEDGGRVRVDSQRVDIGIEGKRSIARPERKRVGHVAEQRARVCEVRTGGKVRGHGGVEANRPMPPGALALQ